MSSKVEETDAEFDARYEAYFNRADIDGWEYRKAMGDLAGMDLVPEPAIVNAALRACRRLNDSALAIRTLEVVKAKCAPNEKELWPYMLQVRIVAEHKMITFWNGSFVKYYIWLQHYSFQIIFILLLF